MPAARAVRVDVMTLAMVGVGILVALAGLVVFRAAPRELTALAVGVLFALAFDPVLGAIPFS